jgi:radical SAM protein with 4Fe4S-binding SPASM domain
MIKTKLDLIVEKSFSKMSYEVSESAEANALLNRAECEKRETRLDSLPFRVRLELTTKCNVNCIFCHRTHFRTDDRSVLSPADIDRLDPILRSAKHISLSQKAESLMSPHIIPILDKMANYEAVFYMSSNGLLLNDDISRALIRNKITFFSISANAFNEDYENFYVGGKFDDLERNIARLNELKKEANSVLPRLRLSFVLRKDTLQNLDAALEFIKRHDFSEGVQVLSFFSFVDEDRHLEPALHWPDYEEDIARLRQKAAAYNIPFELDVDGLDGMRPPARQDYVSNCYEPWESFNVTPDGNIFTCTSAREVMGNFRDESPLEIWNGEKFQKFRSRMNGKPYNNDCTECWHCRYVSPQVIGEKLAKADKIFDSYYRREKPLKSKLQLANELLKSGFGGTGKNARPVSNSLAQID